jgi:predicted protein tyrosine phosphatase
MYNKLLMRCGHRITYRSPTAHRLFAALYHPKDTVFVLLKINTTRLFSSYKAAIKKTYLLLFRNSD